MKVLKIFTGIVTGSYMSRDDGYPETKYRIYNKISDIKFGDKNEQFYSLSELPVNDLKKLVMFEKQETIKGAGI